MQNIIKNRQTYIEKTAALGGGKAMIMTFGCQQNEADSDKLRGMLMQMGYEPTDDKTQADVILMNTCAVREHAELRVFGIIGALVFGIGMCFFLDVFAGAAWLTAILMICGTLLMIPAYPIYRRIARKTKAELTPEILRLSEEIMKS